MKEKQGRNNRQNIKHTIKKKIDLISSFEKVNHQFRNFLYIAEEAENNA